MLWSLAGRLHQAPLDLQAAVLLTPGLLQRGLPLLSHPNDLIVRVFFLLWLVCLVQHHKVNLLLPASRGVG